MLLADKRVVYTAVYTGQTGVYTPVYTERKYARIYFLQYIRVKYIRDVQAKYAYSSRIFVRIYVRVLLCPVMCFASGLDCLLGLLAATGCVAG